MGGKGSGRPRKFQLGDIAYRPTMRVWVAVVGYKTTRTFREYRVIPLDANLRRSGRAYWIRSASLETTGMKSKGTVKTYLANEFIEPRDCSCQCCVHEAMDLHDFNRFGEFRPIEGPR